MRDLPGSPECEAFLPPDECWAIVWRASHYISDFDRTNPFVAEYFNRMFDTIDEMQAAADVVVGELPDDEVPRVVFQDVVEQKMAWLRIVTHDELYASTGQSVSMAIDVVEGALERAFDEHQRAPLPTQITPEYL